MRLILSLLLICSCTGELQTDLGLNASNQTNPQRLQVTILGALTYTEHAQIFDKTPVDSIHEIDVKSFWFILNSNPLLTISELCDSGNRSQAKVIIAGHTPDGSDLTLTAMAYVSDFYHIPIVTVASRENIFSDKVFEKCRAR